MIAIKIPHIVNLDIHEFSGSGITEYHSGMTNIIVHNHNGNMQATQRPSIDVTEDSSGIVALNDRARGIYYWETNSKLYIVHDNDLYEDSQDTTRIAENSGTFSTGTERVTMLETIGTPRLVILDAENDKGWVMTSGKVLDQIASNFPSTICHGGIILDGYLFVMNEDGIIYNSEVDDPTTFPATGYIEAERENDKGVYLGKHHAHAVSFGTKTIEFFYDAANATGSPLTRRSDIVYDIGCPDGLGVWENGDTIYFLGSTHTGQISVYRMANFQIERISTDTIDSYLTQNITQESIRVVMSGLSAMGNDTVLMTIYTLTGASPGTIEPKLTFSFDAVTSMWGFWETTVNNHEFFPLMATTKRTGGQNATVSARTWEGILYNGDIVAMNDKLIPVDTLLGGDGVYASGVYEVDIYSASSSDVGTNISCKIRTGEQSGDIPGYKFQDSFFVMMESTTDSQTMDIKFADDGAAFDAYIVDAEIDVSFPRKYAYAGGSFHRRNYEVSFSFDEQVFISGLGADIEGGD